MKKLITERSRCRDKRAARVMTGGKKFAFRVVMLLWAALLALPPIAAQQEVGNAEQAVGHHVYLGQFPQRYLGRIGSIAEPTVPYVLKTNNRNLDHELNPYTGYFSLQPVRWRVLANDAEGILLLSEYNIAHWAYHTPGGPVTWQDASLRDSLGSRFLQGGTLLGGGGRDFFLPVEQQAVATSTLQNPKMGADTDGVVTQDRVFLLAAADSVLFATAADRIARNTPYAASYRNTSAEGLPDYWLLRTHSASLFNGFAMWVREDDGFVDIMGVSNMTSTLIRPALRLSKDHFIMASTAKPSLGTPSTSLLPATTDTMKLTLVNAADPNLELTVTGQTSYMTIPSTSSLTGLNYSVTAGSTNDYVSMLLETQGGDVVFYQKLVNVTGASSGALIIPLSTVPDGAYVLKIFHEQVNASVSDPDVAGLPVQIYIGISNTSLPPAISTVQGTSDDLSDGWVNILYADTVSFSGTPAPVLSISAGSLPPGLSLEQTGRIHGTPTTAGSYTFTVRALNGGGEDTQQYTVDIAASAAPVIMSPAAGMIDSVVRNTYYAGIDTIEASGGPAPEFTVTGFLPVGLVLDRVTGIISGTPTLEETATFTVTATNQLGLDSRQYSIKVKLANTPTPPSFITKALPDAYAGTPYNFTVLAAGEPAPNFLIVAPDVLPNGLSLHPTTGVISGTPTMATPASSPWSVKIRIENSGGVVDSVFQLVVNHTLNPPHLTLTSLAPGSIVGSDPFSVTATFDQPVSGVTASQIAVTGGIASSVAMDGTPTTTTPPRSTVWTFEVTPATTSGSVIEAYLPAGAALSATGANTWKESDTVRVVYQTDVPHISFGVAHGTVYFTDPNHFTFDIIPNGSTSNIYVDNNLMSHLNIRDAIEIRKNGDLYTSWSTSISGLSVTVTGIFGQGDYVVSVKPNRIANDFFKHAPQTILNFSVQLSANWYENCLQNFTLKFPAWAADRTLRVVYGGQAAEYLTDGNGGTPPDEYLLEAGDSTVLFSYRTKQVPVELEGDSVSITVTDATLGVTDTYWFEFWNLPRAEDVIYIPKTVLYPGFFKLVKGGSPDLMRSLNGGWQWYNAWGNATGVELQNVEEAIILREPDGCEELTILLDLSINPNIQREIVLPSVPNVTTTPGVGQHYVASGADFVFTVTPTGPVAGLWPHVTSNRQHVPDSVGTIVTDNGNGTFEVRIRALRESISVDIRMGQRPSSDNGYVETAGVWTFAGHLYIASPVTGEARVYSSTGALVKSVPVTAGETVRTPLPQGFYIIALPNGSTTKVINK